jgi:hypothetical protein
MSRRGLHGVKPREYRNARLGVSFLSIAAKDLAGVTESGGERIQVA